MAEAITIQVISSDLGEKFQRLMFTDRNFRAQMIKTIKQQLGKARNNTVKDIKQFVGSGYPHSQGDPRQAFRAVKYSAYKDGMGGQISLFNKRKASQNRVDLKRERKLDKNPKQRGGNRMKRNPNTKSASLEAYWGSDRSFILRFLNVGTVQRENKHGNCGAIASRDSFSRISVWHMTEAAKEIEKQAAEAIEQIWKD